MTRVLPILVAIVALAIWVHGRRPDFRVIDLRSDSAYTAGHIPGAEHMSLAQLRQTRFRPDETILLYSGSGGDAAQGWVFLHASGLQHVYALNGGADEWADRRRWRGGC
jgi:hydroxyacylglutathione hydrolase